MSLSRPADWAAVFKHARLYSRNRSYLPFTRPITNNLNAIGDAVGQDSETESTEHCPKYKQSTVI